MVLKFYGGSTGSPATQLVAVILHEKRIPFDFINVDLSKGEHKTAEFQTKNPFSQIPCIVSVSRANSSISSKSKFQGR